MNEKTPPHDVLPDDGQLVSCHTCLKQVPKSGAKITEAQDYVMYFCGITCLDKWKKQKSTSDNK